MFNAMYKANKSRPENIIGIDESQSSLENRFNHDASTVAGFKSEHYSSGKPSPSRAPANLERKETSVSVD